jgi:hypothetical protein
MFYPQKPRFFHVKEAVKDNLSKMTLESQTDRSQYDHLMATTRTNLTEKSKNHKPEPSNATLLNASKASHHDAHKSLDKSKSEKLNIQKFYVKPSTGPEIYEAYQNSKDMFNSSLTLAQMSQPIKPKTINALRLEADLRDKYGFDPNETKFLIKNGLLNLKKLQAKQKKKPLSCETDDSINFLSKLPTQPTDPFDSLDDVPRAATARAKKEFTIRIPVLNTKKPNWDAKQHIDRNTPRPKTGIFQTAPKIESNTLRMRTPEIEILSPNYRPQTNLAEKKSHIASRSKLGSKNSLESPNGTPLLASRFNENGSKTGRDMASPNSMDATLEMNINDDFLVGGIFPSVRNYGKDNEPEEEKEISPRKREPVYFPKAEKKKEVDEYICQEKAARCKR